MSAKKPKKPHYKGADGTWSGGGDTYSIEVAEHICDQLAEGKSLVTVLKAPNMPEYRTVLRWLKNHAEFADMYATARADSADANADAITAVAEQCLAGTVDPHAARVAIDAMKWTAGRRMPKKYGEFSRNEISGPDGGPIETRSLTDEERARRIEELLAKRSKR